MRVRRWGSRRPREFGTRSVARGASTATPAASARVRIRRRCLADRLCQECAPHTGSAAARSPVEARLVRRSAPTWAPPASHGSFELKKMESAARCVCDNDICETCDTRWIAIRIEPAAHT
ncbi:hypothetical protein BE221DRAFT_65318 [Ostreococcus tauri]|uniref:Uncharacterized protein n=1 Tax=Ostreococcus tauri TaxID=70448 RepID=A0A1Y5IRB4_OSTTA|nr:hypothetical protein BE221DRAFT_65318 [Ostreococcus tauri]